MARFTIVDEDREITNADELMLLLEPLGVSHERWDIADRVDVNATDEEILQAFRPEIERLQQREGYVKADVINISPDTPGLDQLLSKFSKEHTHSDDEVRFTVAGQGVFYIRTVAEVLAVHVEAGDLISVPAGTRHWFTLCNDRTIRCIRLFNDPAGWAAEYVDAH